MRISDAKSLAEKIIADQSMNVDVIFGEARSELCRRAEKRKFPTIYLSRTGVRLNSEREVMNAIIHQLAHLATGEDTHSDAWKRRFMAMGGFGGAARVHFKKPRPKFSLICMKCASVIARSNKRDGASTYCLKCGPSQKSCWVRSGAKSRW